MNQLNNFTDDEKENELNLPNCKYRDKDYFKNLTKDFKRNAGSFFHMNIWSLTKNFDGFNILLSDLNVSFDILAIKETRIKKDLSSPINLQLNNYSIEHSPTESLAAETLLYINKSLSYQPRNDLRLFDPGTIESTFIEIIFSKSIDVIVGCSYKHPTLPINDVHRWFYFSFTTEIAKRIIQKSFSPLRFSLSFSLYWYS